MPKPHLHPADDGPIVTTRGDRRSLQFRPGMIQSEMRLSRPDELVLRYARAMMCFALFQRRPRHILMVGLGGGSLAKFCYRHLPDCRITVLELRADVIALREQFLIPSDDARFRIVHADAAVHIAGLRSAVDVMLVDGFDDIGLPPALGSARFYADCRRALRPDGVLVANIFNYDPHYESMVARLNKSFDRRICQLDGIAGNNHIIFAVKPAIGKPSHPASMQRLLALRAHVGLTFLNRILVRLLVHWLSRTGVAGRRR
jgi:spermidine synthase